MKFKVNSGYVGLKTQGQHIYPGIYDIDSPYLYGCANDIAEAGLGEYVDDSEEPQVSDTEPQVAPASVEEALGGFDDSELPHELVAAAAASVIEPAPEELPVEPVEPEAEAEEPKRRRRKTGN